MGFDFRGAVFSGMIFSVPSKREVGRLPSSVTEEDLRRGMLNKQGWGGNRQVFPEGIGPYLSETPDRQRCR